MASTYPGSLDALSNPTSSSLLNSPSHSLQHSDVNDAVEAIEAKLGVGTATASTAVSGQVLMKGATDTTWSTITSLTNPTITSPEETINIIATASSGTVSADFLTAGVTYGTANATANWVMNMRGNGTTTINSMISVGQSISHTFLNTNGATAYYPTSYTVDGTAITPKWQTGSAPSAGNASSVDAYAFTLIKTAVTPTYTLLASQTKFA